MRPVKRKQISSIVAERLGLSAETVDEMASCYFKIVQKKLSNLEDMRIVVDKLGTFTLKRKKLEEKRLHYGMALAKFEAIENPDMIVYKNILRIKRDIESYDKAIALFKEDDERLELKKEEKINYKTKNNESNKNLEG